MNKLIHFILLIISQTINGQIWNYPPEPLFTYKEYKDFKMDQVRTFKVYVRELDSTGKLNEFHCTLEQNLDTQGRIKKMIQGKDTILYTKFKNGFWTEGSLNGELFTQYLVFDKKGNITYIKNGNQVDSIIYDSKSRPIACYSRKQEAYWSYQNGRLVSFIRKSDGETYESNYYNHDTINGSLSFITCRSFYIDRNKQEICDSTFAKLNQLGKPTYIQVIKLNGDQSDTIVMTINYDINFNNLGGTLNCSRIENVYNEKGYRIYTRSYDCLNNLIYEEKYEYTLF